MFSRGIDRQFPDFLENQTEHYPSLLLKKKVKWQEMKILIIYMI